MSEIKIFSNVNCSKWNISYFVTDLMISPSSIWFFYIIHTEYCTIENNLNNSQGCRHPFGFYCQSCIHITFRIEGEKRRRIVRPFFSFFFSFFARMFHTRIYSIKRRKCLIYYNINGRVVFETLFLQNRDYISKNCHCKTCIYI